MREPAIIPGSLVGLKAGTAFVRTFMGPGNGPMASEPTPAEGPALLGSQLAMVVCRPGRNMMALLVWHDDGPTMGWAPIEQLRSLS